MSASRPRRSCLYMPGANAKALEKAKGLPADALLFDLEDAVAPEAKADARSAVVAAVAGGGYGKRELVIRVNALSTPWGRDDVRAAASARPDGVLFPKIDGPGDIEAAEAALRDAGAPDDIAIWAMIETPKAILSIGEIARGPTASRRSTASTTTSRTPRASPPSAATAWTSASTGKR
jgi:citrate lyase subunit beta / citryl-CoA lyase